MAVLWAFFKEENFMSCHDIGRGLNEVVRMTITQYDKGEVSHEAAVKIIATCKVAVNWCDGNGYEAIDYISRCRCGKCLKMIPKGEKLFSLWDLPYAYRESDIMEKARMATDSLCEECFDKIMPEYCSDNDNTETLKEKIIKNNEDHPERYLSEGEHKNHNNGCEWVRETD